MSLPEDANGVESVDPAAAFEEVISKQLLQLSVEDRNHLQEEIHGVRCMAPEETPRLVEDSLRKLAIEIDENIPDSKKRAYIVSQQRQASRQFVNSREFRLRFLRCELFDYKKAAERMMRVCNSLLDLFGRYALERPIRLSDFSNAELKVLRKGRQQILPFRDRSGRRIAIMFPGAESLKEGTANNHRRQNVRDFQIKQFMYMSWVAGLEVDAQRRGVVFVVWFDRMLQANASLDVKRIGNNVKAHRMSMIRGSAIHICSPDTPFFRLQRSIIALGAGAFMKRLRTHLGEPMEMRYILSGYGISTDTLPITWTGIVKSGYMKQWIRIRQHLEDPALLVQEECDGSQACCAAMRNIVNVNQTNNILCKYSQPIECPLLTDILFKKGKSPRYHPGNVHFRNQIQKTYELERCKALSIIHGGRNLNGGEEFELDAATTSIIREFLVEYYCREVQQGKLRVLMWNERQAWWINVINEKLIRKKIESTVMSCTEIVARPPSPPEELSPQEQFPIDSNNCFDRCGDFASELASQGLESGSKRRRLVVNDSNISGAKPMNFENLSDDESIFDAPWCFGQACKKNNDQSNS